MAKNASRDLIVGLDIGTSKIAAIVGEINNNNELEVIGFGSHPSIGLRRGVVVNIESTVHSMQRAIEEAELMAGCEINSAFTGISGSHIQSLNSHGIVAIKDREVSQYDIDRVIDAAKAVAIPSDQKILHVLPQEFLIDSQDGVKEPVGMSGVRLEAKVHIVTGAVSAAQNIAKCVKSCGLHVNDIILEQLASSHSVLTEDEKELGVCLIDIGGGTTDISLFSEGSICHTAVIPIAGDHVTNDIAVALRTPTKHAEAIKIEHATVMTDLVDSKETIQVPSVANRPPKEIYKKAIAQVANARYTELFSLISSEIRKSGFEDLMVAGVVLTGGASKIAGVMELAESIFEVPVRLGTPQNVQGISEIRENPGFATGVGLLLHGLQQRESGKDFELHGSLKKLFSKMRSWFNGNF